MNGSMLHMLRIICWPRVVNEEVPGTAVTGAIRDTAFSLRSLRAKRMLAMSMGREWRVFEICEAIRRDEKRLNLLMEWKSLI